MRHPSTKKSTTKETTLPLAFHAIQDMNDSPIVNLFLIQGMCPPPPQIFGLPVTHVLMELCQWQKKEQTKKTSNIQHTARPQGRCKERSMDEACYESGHDEEDCRRDEEDYGRW